MSLLVIILILAIYLLIAVYTQLKYNKLSHDDKCFLSSLRTYENNLSLGKHMLVEKINVLKSRASNSRTVFPKGPWNHLSRPHCLKTKEQTDIFQFPFTLQLPRRPH